MQGTDLITDGWIARGQSGAVGTAVVEGGKRQRQKAPHHFLPRVQLGDQQTMRYGRLIEKQNIRVDKCDGYQAEYQYRVLCEK